MSYVFRVPGHVTGFFKPVITGDPLTSGSIGAGFAVKKYVYTEAKIDRSGKIRVFFDNVEVSQQACTSYTVAKMLLDEYNLGSGVIIEHKFEVPIGVGLATSGAGSLGVAFSINSLFDLGLERAELARFAHMAEIKCKTGLGSVIAQFDGKFEVRLRAGAPGIGEVARFDVERDVAILAFRDIPTKKMLSSKDVLDSITRAFGNKHEELSKGFSVEKFCNYSKNFAVESGLLTDLSGRVLSLAEKYDLMGSMLMFGEGVFLFGDDLEAKISRLLANLKGDLKPRHILLTSIDNEGVAEV